MAVGELIAARAELADGDVVVVSQKIVSKAEGRIRRLSSVLPGSEARRLAAVLGKEPALVELILEESQRGAARRARRADRRDASRLRLRQRRHRQLQPARGRHGLPAARGPRRLGPAHPRRDPRPPPGPRLRVIVSDSFGRAWRLGQAEVAIGCAGLTPLDDWRGRARRRRPRAGGDPDRGRRRGRGGGRPGPRQGEPRAGGDRPRPRPLRQRRRRPRRRGPAPPPRRGLLPLTGRDLHQLVSLSGGEVDAVQSWRTAAPRRRPLRIESSASVGLGQRMDLDLGPIGTRGASSMNSSPSRRVRLATEPSTRSPQRTRRGRPGCRSCGCRR